MLSFSESGLCVESVWPGEVIPTYLLHCDVLEAVAAAATFLHSFEILAGHINEPPATNQHTGWPEPKTLSQNCRQQKTP